MGGGGVSGPNDSVDKSKLYSAYQQVDRQHLLGGETLLIANHLQRLLTHSLAYLLTHWLTYSLTGLLTHSLAYLLTHSLTHLLPFLGVSMCVTSSHQ